ncbi:hypothetical protein DOTSEDRAFT_62869 [Dothistroma septosporum NZE10]|uniref:Uncharacterized protein n=1 Tax=Dothistroma septosporum (strain NZE10 / CBS 128990) TaxID=675120 RepID=N1PM62_DOTSN|nr:hypothetical protein DOTSEDRAFT_62869 [Dothistroma septosporum NZE10]
MEFLHGPTTAPSSVKEVLDFHTALCTRLEQPIPNTTTEVPLRWPQLQTLEGSLLLPVAEYRIRAPFQECFNVIRTEPHEHSIGTPPAKSRDVTIVFLPSDRRSARDIALEHGCLEDEDDTMRLEESDGLEGTLAFRCSLEQAMKLVVYLDPERRMAKKEWHGHYREWLENVEGRYELAPCRCTGCVPRLGDGWNAS